MQASDLATLDLAGAIIREPIIIEPDCLVSQAVVLMSAVGDRCSTVQLEDDQVEIARLQQDARSSCLLVVEAGQLIGIFTERDVVRLSALGALRLGVCVREVMTSPVITLQQSELCDPFAVLNRFWHRRIRHLPVVDEQNNVLGMVTHESLRHLLRPGHLLRSQSVLEVMSADVVSASPSISVLEAAQLLANHRVSCLILTEEQTSDVGDVIEVATGIITERDIVQFQALELDFEALDAAAVMSSPVFSALLNTSLWDVQQLMQRQGIRRIIVKGNDGSLQGIVTQSSLLKALSPVDLCRLVEKLKQRVAKLEDDKLAILEQRALELEQEVQARTQDLVLKVEREQLLAAVASDVRASLVLDDVLQTAVERIQALFQCDRVALWKMQPDRSVEIVAEAIVAGIPSNLGKIVLDPCFDMPAWVEAYRQGRTNVLEDIDTHPIADCHRDLLKGLHIHAQVLVPVLQHGKLWGLFSVSESQGPRQWLIEEVTLLRELSIQLAIAIQQAEAYQKAKDELAERLRAEKQILYNALHDSLTDLPNRSFVLNELASYLNKTPLENSIGQLSVLLLDLDRFKIVNDSLGHAAGDQLLEVVAQMLTASLREGDIAVRLGGDEFVVLLKGLEAEAVCNIAERIRSLFQTPIRLQNREVFVTASIGIVLEGMPYDSPTALLRDADIAMYQAKSRGRNCYAIFDEGMYEKALRRLNLERELRQAIDQQEFVVYYQPIMEIATQQLAGFEALVRWQHPELGFISPGEFIPLAEETGLIIELTTWVLETACRQLVQWQTAFENLSDLKMSVNLSVQDLLKPTFSHEVQQILSKTGLSSYCLTLEVTENLLITNIDTTVKVLNELKHLGIRISIDDFGTGYSSLQYLSYLPCDNLKIDRAFVSGLEAGDRNNKLVKVIIALSEQLGLDSVAEGIETQQQLDWLKSLGCKFAQGYFFSKPLAEKEIDRLLVEEYGAILAKTAALHIHRCFMQSR